MADNHRKPSSERSSSNTGQSSPELLHLAKSPNREALSTTPKRSTSSPSFSASIKYFYGYDVESPLGAHEENYEEMSSNATDKLNTSDRSSNFDESSSFVTGTSTSTAETRLSTTDVESDSTRKTDVTNYSDNSDSAYTNSHSNFTQTLNSNLTYSSETQASARDADVNDDKNGFVRVETVSNENIKVDSSNLQQVNESSTQTPNTANLNVISNVQLSQSTLDIIFNQVLQDVNSKQPNSFNVKSLSATLPLDEAEMKEQEKKKDDSKIINVQPVPSFYLNRKEEIVVTSEHNRVIKYMISNVGAGSPYSKPAEVPQVIVPRYSALPRTSSMEVNTSSVESTDRESDTVSLVDSLEDALSPRDDQIVPGKQEEKKQDDLSILLPDNSEKKKTKTPQKSAVFFIPIESKQKEDFKPVSYHLPARVKEKLSKRQLRREQKIQQAKSNYTSPRSDSNYISASDNGNQITFTVNNNSECDVKSIPILPEVINHKTRRKSKAILPSIQNIRKIKIDSKDNIRYTECEKIRDRFNKPIKRKSITKYEKIVSKGKNSKQSPRISSTSFHHHGFPEKLTPIYTSRNEYRCESMPKGIYHRTEFGNANKRIEILEIMECVDDAQKHHSFPKGGKSKIPVLVPHNKLPKIEKRTTRPVYLDFEQDQNRDHKVDQLIANILIDTLNKYENYSAPSSRDTKKNNTRLSNEKRSDETYLANRHQQKFDAIPEEVSLQSSVEENSKRNDKITSNGNLIEAAADIITKHVLKNSNMQENLLKNNKSKSVSSSTENSRSEELLKPKNIDGIFTVPQGWITFYMLHKNQESSDSTSDEGTKSPENLKNKNRNDSTKEMYNKNDANIKDVNTKSEKFLESSEDLTVIKKEKSRRDTLDTILSSDAFSDNLNSVIPTSNTERYSKQQSFKSNNDSKTKFSSSEECTTHGWSVTVSGMNTYGQLAPDVEMRLKFPPPKDDADCSSESKEDAENVNNNAAYCYPTERTCQLLKRHNHRNNSNSVVGVESTDDNDRSERLPLINQNRRLSQHIDTNLTSSVLPYGFEPRQTKTSSRRYALNRPRNLQAIDSNVTTENILNLSTERILRKFPEILAISGNGINPEQRSYIYTNPK